MLATFPLTPTAADDDANVYAPSLLLIPAITSLSENEASTPKVLDTCDMDWYAGDPRATSTVNVLVPPL